MNIKLNVIHVIPIVQIQNVMELMEYVMNVKKECIQIQNKNENV